MGKRARPGGPARQVSALHLKAYKRIFQLRYFRRTPSAQAMRGHFYELVEIPKALLQRSKQGEFTMQHLSAQTPKPGYCTVRDRGKVSFRLYFDGGIERRLQIKDLRKELCRVHATWAF